MREREKEEEVAQKIRRYYVGVVGDVDEDMAKNDLQEISECV